MHWPQPELERLRHSALRMGDETELSGQAELSEARERLAATPLQRLAALSGDQREGHRQVGTRLLHSHPARDVHEHVRGGQ